jgi:nitroimidazol reductase NimA-like FMN-containing flavoprotein (pyridoxamine 5'-phosphate oxidase superfamily)
MANEKREIKRKPHRSVEEIEEVYSILDEGLVAHVGFTDPDSQETVVIPVAYGRDGDRILFHGSTGSRMFMALKSGAQICATVTLLDGLVSARSPFNSSMNYRSVMAFGVPKVLEGDEKEKALFAVSERLIPGLWDAGREQTKKEFAQTLMVELKLDDVTAKKRTGDALDDEEDLQLPIWAGYIPINTSFGEPVTNENAKHLPVPDYIKNLMKRKAEKTKEN